MPTKTMIKADSQTAHGQPEQTRNVGTRLLRVRAKTVNEEQRSVEAVLATENPVTTIDWRDMKYVDEVLQIERGEYGEQVPMLDSHNRYELKDIIGSVRDIRMEKGELVGTLHFSDDPDGDRAFRKMSGGHLTDVSVGFQILERTRIPKGETAMINGKSYKAEARGMHVITGWRLFEVSAVAIGADQYSKIRGQQCPQPQEIDIMTTEEKARLEAEEKKRQAQATPPPPEPTKVEPVDQDAIRAEAVKAYRDRVKAIEALAGDDVPQEKVREAIDKDMSVEQATKLFLDSVRAARAEALNTGPDIHIKQKRESVDHLGAALRMRAGLKYEPKKNMTEDQKREWELIAEDAEKFTSMTQLDLCREALRIKGLDYHSGSAVEIVRRAFSFGDMLPAFTNSISAALMQEYDQVPDVTPEFTSEVDVPNFKVNERIIGTMKNGMRLLPRGGEAVHQDIQADAEEYKVASFASQEQITFEDIVDDNLDYLSREPMRLAADAKDVKVDLVFSILLGNPTMRDGSALWHTSNHGNYATTGSDLADSTLQAGIAAMWKQKDNGKPVQARPVTLLVDPTKVFTAAVLAGSAERTTTSGNLNPIDAINPLRVLADSRIGLGVNNPLTGAAVSGAADNWFLFANPRRHPTIEVGFLSGTGRAPEVRFFELSQGRWGIGYDVRLNVGVKALDWRAMYKATGASSG